MKDIKIAMTVDGELFEEGDNILLIDRDGGIHEGKFIRTYRHSFMPEWMVVRYRNVDGEKVAVVGTNAQKIKKVRGKKSA